MIKAWIHFKYWVGRRQVISITTPKTIRYLGIKVSVKLRSLNDCMVFPQADVFELTFFGCLGSLLVGTTPGDSVMLKDRVRQLTEAGLRAEYLSSNELLSEEPAVFVGCDGGAAFAPDDCQLDAQRSVTYIEKVSLFSLSLF